MNYTNQEIARAKALCARDLRQDRPQHTAILASVQIGRPWPKGEVTHARTWRDYLPQARRELRQEASD